MYSLKLELLYIRLRNEKYNFSWLSLIYYLQGLILQRTVVDAVSRLFMVRMRLGEFDPPEMNPYTKYVALCSLVVPIFKGIVHDNNIVAYN